MAPCENKSASDGTLRERMICGCNRLSGRFARHSAQLMVTS